MKKTLIYVSLFLQTVFSYSQTGDFIYETKELEDNFKYIKVKNLEGMHASYLYEGDLDDVEKAFMEAGELQISETGLDIYEQTLWLPDDKSGVMPSDILFSPARSKIYIYGGRRLMIVNEDTFTHEKSITVSDKGSLSDMSFMPISPYRYQLALSGPSNHLLCATTGGELVVIDQFTNEILDAITDNEDVQLLSASVKYNVYNESVIWVLNYWNGTTKIKKYTYDINNGYQLDEEIVWASDEIFDFVIDQNRIIVAMLENTLELDPSDLSTLITHNVTIDKLELHDGLAYGHVKGEEQIIAIEGGAPQYINNIPIDYAFGSCYDQKNHIVYFTGIDVDIPNETVFNTVNYCPGTETINYYNHIGAIAPVYNPHHELVFDYYTVACAGKHHFVGYDNDGLASQSITTEDHHGYRMTLDVNLGEPHRIGGIVACLKDGIVKLFQSYWCLYAPDLKFFTTGISCSHTCYNQADNTAFFFYTGDGRNNSYSVYNEETGNHHIARFDYGEVSNHGRVLDCVYNDDEEQVYVAFRDDYNERNLVLKVGENFANIYTPELDGIPEILLSFEDKVYCIANNYETSNAYIYQIDANDLTQIINHVFPGSRIIAIEKNVEDQKAYAILEGLNEVVEVDLINFTYQKHNSNSYDPNDICYNDRDNKIYIANYDFNRIDVYNTSFTIFGSVSLTGKPKRLEYNPFQNNVYAISDYDGFGHNYLSVIDCEAQIVINDYEIRKSDGLIYDTINDQIYLHTNYPSPDDNMEINIKTFNNFDDDFSNKVNTGNYSFNDIMLNKKRLIQSKPSINPENNNLYVGNYALASASIINAYEERFTFKTGWNWLSFPRMERYKNEIFDAITLLERISPWAPDFLEMIYEPDGIDPKSIEFFEGEWITTGELTELKSTEGYKLYYENDVLDFSLRLEGAKLDYDTEIDLIEGENWVGYYLIDPQLPEQCLPEDLWDDLEQIKTQFWSMTKVPYGGPDYWFIEGKKAPFEYGDLVILKTLKPYSNFQWQISGDDPGPGGISLTTYYSFEEQADYLPFYIETDSTSDIQEIAILANGEVKGASVRQPGDTIVEVKGYLDDVPPDAVIEFETWTGYKSMPVEKDGYVVFDHKRKTKEKKNIYAGEKASYYHVSLKSNEVYKLPPDVSTVSCHPNPFSSSLELSFRLNREADIYLFIFDISGNRIKTIINGDYPEGYYNFTWDGTNETGSRISPGVYFYKLSTGQGTVITDKIVMIK